MSHSRRSILAAAGVAGLASLGPAATAAPQAVSTDRTIDQLVRRSELANQALMRGDAATYRAMVSLTDDFVLMSPFGGTPSRVSSIDEERWKAMGRFFRNGTLEQELVEAYASPDMVVLAVIERAHVEVGGLPAQPWGLRVTLVYRRDGAEWRLAHRHADPLADGITLEQSAALARAGLPTEGEDG